MNRTSRTSCTIAAIAFALIVGLPGPASAWQRYYEGCDSCHPAEMHGRHRANVNDQCEACHVQGTDRVFLRRSEGGLPGPGPSNLSCLGCHGRLDATGTVQGYGLRRGHISRGEGGCDKGGCHDNDPVPPPENVMPPSYVRTDFVSNEPCNTDGSEDWDRSAFGLDNDGDGLYDANDPDCQVPTCVVPPGRVDGLVAAKDAAASLQDVVFWWQPEGVSGSYRVYSLDSKADYKAPGGPPRATQPAATLRCFTQDQSTLTCAHQGALAMTPDLLLYEVVGVCQGDDSVEGAN